MVGGVVEETGFRSQESGVRIWQMEERGQGIRAFMNCELLSSFLPLRTAFCLLPTAYCV